MSRESFVFLAGIVIVVIPQLGIPPSWKEYALFGIGVLLILVGYSLRRAAFIRSIEQDNGEHETDSYVESIHQSSDVK